MRERIHELEQKNKELERLFIQQKKEAQQHKQEKEEEAKRMQELRVQMNNMQHGYEAQIAKLVAELGNNFGSGDSSRRGGQRSVAEDGQRIRNDVSPAYNMPVQRTPNKKERSP